MPNQPLRRTLLCVATVVAVSSGLLITGSFPRASASTGASVVDFNGDGYSDVAFGAPDVVGDDPSLYGGSVTAVYGSADGLGERQTISQDSEGVPGTAEYDNAFGQSLEPADLDRDGFTDLVVGSPGVPHDPQGGRGSVTVLWGSPDGLSGGTLLSPPEESFDEARHYGQDLAVADFDGDGALDVAAVAYADDADVWVLKGPFTRTGASGAPVPIKTSDIAFEPSSLAAGDVDGDGVGDLAVMGYSAATNQLVLTAVLAEGGPSGFTLGDAFHPYSGRVAEGTHMFGAIADFDRDGHGDLAVGLPVKYTDESGSVNVYYGTGSGLSMTRTQTLTQDTPGVPGTVEAEDCFGSDVSAGDVDGDGFPDLAVGVKGEMVDGIGAGGVNLLRGGSSGLVGEGAQLFTQATSEIDGDPETTGLFGATVRLGDVTRDGRADLLVSDPSVDIGPDSSPGGYAYALWGTSEGLTAHDSLLLGPGLGSVLGN